MTSNIMKKWIPRTTIVRTIESKLTFTFNDNILKIIKTCKTKIAPKFTIKFFFSFFIGFFDFKYYFVTKQL